MGTERIWQAYARLILVCMVVVVPTVGCRCPEAVQTYEYLSDYARMVDDYEPLVSLVYVPGDAVLSDYRGMIVGNVDVGSQWVESPEEAGSYATFFRIVLAKQLRELDQFSYVTLDGGEGKPPEAFAGALRVDGKITKFDTGSGLLRYLSYFAFFLQGGATDFQLEGRITEADTGRLLVEFADRRRHLGNTPFGPNPANFRKGFAMHVTVRETAECLARFIGEACTGLPAACVEPADAVETACQF